MSIENPNPSHSPAAANLVNNPSEYSYADVVQNALADPANTGAEIADMFIGDLVAGDGVTTSRGEVKGAKSILEDVDFSVSAQARHIPWDDTRHYIVRMAAYVTL